jgi:hypothetical protein
MKTSTKIIWAIVGVGALATAGFFIIRRFRKRRIMPPPTPTNGTTPSPSPTGAYSSDAFPLKQGSGGRRVKAVQKWLNDGAHWLAVKPSTGFTGTCHLVEDGKWGSKTDACYKRMRNPNDANQDDSIGKTYYDKHILKYES